MANVDKLDDLELYQELIKMKRIGNRAVHKAQQRNRELGIPNVYSRDGIIYHENQNGEIVPGNPFADS